MGNWHSLTYMVLSLSAGDEASGVFMCNSKDPLQIFPDFPASCFWMGLK